MPSPHTGGAGPVLLLPDSVPTLAVPAVDVDVSELALASPDVSELELVLVVVSVDVSRLPSLSVVLEEQSVTPRSAMIASIFSTTHPVASKVTQITRGSLPAAHGSWESVGWCTA